MLFAKRQKRGRKRNHLLSRNLFLPPPQHFQFSSTRNQHVIFFFSSRAPQSIDRKVVVVVLPFLLVNLECFLNLLWKQEPDRPAGKPGVYKDCERLRMCSTLRLFSVPPPSPLLLLLRTESSTQFCSSPCSSCDSFSFFSVFPEKPVCYLQCGRWGRHMLVAALFSLCVVNTPTANLRAVRALVFYSCSPLLSPLLICSNAWVGGDKPERGGACCCEWC